MANACATCGYANADDALTCNLCSEVLRKAPAGGTGEYVVTCYPYKPIVLSPQAALTIGRGENNDLVLPAAIVSRHHATIFWNGDGYTIKDHGSANGTFLNGGRRVTEERLAPGDRITIGTFEVGFAERSASRPVPKARVEPLTEKTLEVDISGLKSGFSGSVEDISVSQVVQTVANDGKTGRLHLASGGASGEIFFRNGRLVHARFKRHAGEEAVYAMLHLEEGTFTFDAGEETEEETVMMPVGGLLIEAARRLDELRS